MLHAVACTQDGSVWSQLGNEKCHVDDWAIRTGSLKDHVRPEWSVNRFMLLELQDRNIHCGSRSLAISAPL